MGAQHHLVKTLRLAIGHDTHTLRIAFNQTHRRIQAFVRQVGDYFFNIMACAALDREPTWPVGDLNQAMVVTKPDHRGDRKLQHLIGRAAPDAT
jgi:hypothetical protein